MGGEGREAAPARPQAHAFASGASVSPSVKGANPCPMLPLQGDRCLMGQQRSFRKRKPTSSCVKGRSFTSALRSRVCECRASDFLW